MSVPQAVQVVSSIQQHLSSWYGLQQAGKSSVKLAIEIPVADDSAQAVSLRTWPLVAPNQQAVAFKPHLPDPADGGGGTEAFEGAAQSL